MIKNFLLSNLPEFREILQIENTDCVTLEVEVDTRTNRYMVYGRNNFDLSSQIFLGEGILTKEDLEFLSRF